MAQGGECSLENYRCRFKQNDNKFLFQSFLWWKPIKNNFLYFIIHIALEKEKHLIRLFYNNPLRFQLKKISKTVFPKVEFSRFEIDIFLLTLVLLVLVSLIVSWLCTTPEKSGLVRKKILNIKNLKTKGFILFNLFNY